MRSGTQQYTVQCQFPILRHARVDADRRTLYRSRTNFPRYGENQYEKNASSSTRCREERARSDRGMRVHPITTEMHLRA